MRARKSIQTTQVHEEKRERERGSKLLVHVEDRVVEGVKKKVGMKL